MFEEYRIFIIAGFVLFVAYLNYVLFRTLRSGNLGSEFRLYRDALKHTRNPWQGEDKDLAELHRIVKSLNTQHAETNGEDDGA